MPYAELLHCKIFCFLDHQMEVGFFVKAFFDRFQSKKNTSTYNDTFLGNAGLIQLKDALKKENQMSNNWKYNFKPFSGSRLHCQGHFA